MSKQQFFLNYAHIISNATNNTEFEIVSMRLGTYDKVDAFRMWGGKEKHCWACVTFAPRDNTWCHCSSLRKLYIIQLVDRNKDGKTHLSTPLKSHKLQRMEWGRKEERKKNTKAINQTHLPSPLHCFSPFPSLLVVLSFQWRLKPRFYL